MKVIANTTVLRSRGRGHKNNIKRCMRCIHVTPLPEPDKKYRITPYLRCGRLMNKDGIIYSGEFKINCQYFVSDPAQGYYRLMCKKCQHSIRVSNCVPEINFANSGKCKFFEAKKIL